MFEPTKTDLGNLYDTMRSIRESIEGTDEAPQTMHPQEDPIIDAEDFNMEDYSKDDLEKVKSKTKDVAKEVPDKDLVQKPKKVDKKMTKESNTNVKENANHPLHLCNECFRTFRNSERICLYCDSGDVLPIVSVNEGVLELVGEIEGVDREDQEAVRQAIKRGVIADEWPDDEDMIDALSSLEDTVSPMRGEEDIRSAYLRHVLVPKALVHMDESTVEEQEEGESDPAMNSRKAELKAKMAEMEEAHAKRMEQMAKELEGMN